MPKIGVLLNGCGNIDGGDIHEAALTLLYLAQAGGEYFIFAPDVSFEAINFITKQPAGETRSTLLEAARIARGEISDLKDVSEKDMDALVIPGGLGAIKNLSDFATKGENAAILPDVARIIREVNDAGKPVGAVCIAPALLALALGDKKPKITIGDDMGTAQKLEALGAEHAACNVDEICVDEANNLITTSAYMQGPGIADIAKGIEKLCREVVKRA